MYPTFPYVREGTNPALWNYNTFNHHESHNPMFSYPVLNPTIPPANHSTVEITAAWQISEGNEGIMGSNLRGSSRVGDVGGQNNGIEFAPQYPSPHLSDVGVGVGEGASNGANEKEDNENETKVQSEAAKKLKRKIKNRESAARSRARMKV